MEFVGVAGDVTVVDHAPIRAREADNEPLDRSRELCFNNIMRHVTPIMVYNQSAIFVWCGSLFFSRDNVILSKRGPIAIPSARSRINQEKSMLTDTYSAPTHMVLLTEAETEKVTGGLLSLLLLLASECEGCKSPPPPNHCPPCNP